MTATMTPPFQPPLPRNSLQRRFLMSIRDEVADRPVEEWPSELLQMCLGLVQKIRPGVTALRSRLEELLTAGIEARSFVRASGSLLPDTDDQLNIVRGLIKQLSAAENAVSASRAVDLRPLKQELCSLEQETTAVRDLLAEALSRTSEAPQPIDWDRVQAAEDAYARGETKLFSRQ